LRTEIAGRLEPSGILFRRTYAGAGIWAPSPKHHANEPPNSYWPNVGVNLVNSAAKREMYVGKLAFASVSMDAPYKRP